MGVCDKNILSVTVVKENFTEQRTIKKDLKAVAGVSIQISGGKIFLLEGIASAKSSNQECA